MTSSNPKTQIKKVNEAAAPSSEAITSSGTISDWTATLALGSRVKWPPSPSLQPPQGNPQARREISSLQHVLALPRGLLLEEQLYLELLNLSKGDNTPLQRTERDSPVGFT